jgi:hypothetical protein
MVWGDDWMLLGGGGRFTPLEIFGAYIVAISNGVKRREDISRVGKGYRSSEGAAFVFLGVVKKLVLKESNWSSG